MARTKTAVEYNNFTRGFITEASPLTYPENASLDEQNININKDGSRQRRFGIDWTSSVHEIVAGSALDTNGYATSSYTWRSAGNNGTDTVGVFQVGRTFYFYDLEAADPSGGYADFLTLSAAQVADDEPVSYTAAYGKLIIAGGGVTVAVCTWDAGSGNVTSVSVEPLIRDRFGVDDGLAVDERPTTLTNNHEYNLRNQGWPDDTLCASDATGAAGVPTYTDPVAYVNTSGALNTGNYPSNADLIWACKLSTISGSAAADIQNLDTFSPWEMEKQIFGTTPAPKGKFIISPFTRSASRIAASGVAGITSDSSSGGFKAVASYAGRLWYGIYEGSVTGGDDNTPKIGNLVLYSQASSDIAKWANCHTDQDPTEEDFGDILETDGGFISIPELGEIISLVPLGESLFVLATNGVWEIFGGDKGFSATNQSVVKVTDVGPLSKTSVASGESAITYWAQEGIYAIQIDPSSLRGAASNLTMETIQSYYDDIPLNLRETARGAYDHVAKQVSWLYNLTDKESSWYYDKEMILDLKTGAFTKRSYDPCDRELAGKGPYLTAQLRLRSVIQGSQLINVTAGGVIVTASGVPVTVAESNAEQRTKSALMYFTADNEISSETYRMCSLTNFDFVDWSQIQNVDLTLGNDAYAYLLTGYLTGGNASRNKWTPYITVHMKRTESGFIETEGGVIELIDDSSCFMQAQWEWTNSPNAGRWSRKQQVYRLPRFVLFDVDHVFSFDVVQTKNKIRGKGKALSLLFESDPLKDMQLLGWSIDIEAE